LSSHDPGKAPTVIELLIAHLLLALVAGLVVLFVAFPYRGRAVPRAERLSEKVVAVTERVAPGEAPPLGVLSDPHKSRTMSARFERVEQQLRTMGWTGLRALGWLVPGRRDATDDNRAEQRVDLTEQERAHTAR
jgi:hypothetical protein